MTPKHNKDIFWNKNKICACCKQNKPLYKYNSENNDMFKIRNICVDCDKQSNIKRIARRKSLKIKRLKCALCDEIGERHHVNYNRPLEIVFLCRFHHKILHKLNYETKTSQNV